MENETVVEPTEARAKYPHVRLWELPIVAEFGSLLRNTGGNDPLDLLNDLNNPKNRHFATVNLPRFVLAVSVSSQVALLAHMQNNDLIPRRLRS